MVKNCFDTVTKLDARTAINPMVNGRESHARNERRVPELIPVLGSQPAQVTEAINSAVGCHYFPPDPRLPPQPSSITARWPVPNYTAR